MVGVLLLRNTPMNQLFNDYSLLSMAGRNGLSKGYTTLPFVFLRYEKPFSDRCRYWQPNAAAEYFLLPSPPP